MELEQALKGMETAKTALRSRQGITSPSYMSEHMDRLAAYTSAVEDHLAQFEFNLEHQERAAYIKALMQPKATPSSSEKTAKYEVAELKGQIKRLSRLVGSAWRLVGEKQSRFNHLEKEARGQV